MVHQARKYGRNIPKLVTLGTGILTMLSAVYGLYLSSKGLMRAIGGGFTELVQQYEVPYFYPAFYSMLSITIVCCLLLGWCGLDQVRLRVGQLKLFIGLFVFEIFYIAFIGGFLWRAPNLGMSVGAASGTAIQGLMPPFFILLPLWAPFTLAWAKKRLASNTISDPKEVLPNVAAGHGETSLARIVRRKLLTALVGGVGGDISFFLVLSVAMSFETLNEHVSAFTFHVVAFLLAGLCVAYLAMLDSPKNPRIPGCNYVAIVLVVSASYFAAALWMQNLLSFFSLLPMALIVGIILNGFSLRALRNCLWAFAGSILGIAGLVIVERILAYAEVSLPFAFWITRGFEWYGFTLGLLLSQLPLRKGRVEDRLNFR